MTGESADPGPPGPRESTQRTESQGRPGGPLLEKVRDQALLLVPSAALSFISLSLKDEFFSQPWHTLWIVVPLALFITLALANILGRGPLRARPAIWVFLTAYVVLFQVAAQSDLLTWHQESVALEDPDVPRSSLPESWGDWRYDRRSQRADTLLRVLTVEPLPSGDLVRGREQLAQLIGVAGANGAMGVALDFYFVRDSAAYAAQDSPIHPADRFLCLAVERAGIPVVAGWRVRLGERGLVRDLYPELLASCIPDDRRGHLLGTRDRDGVIRHVPMRLRGLARTPPLSWIVASTIDESLTPPDEPLIRFSDGAGVVPTTLDEVLQLDSAELREFFRDRFILIGERSTAEVFETAYGERLGVQVHAAAVGNLLTGDWIRPLPWWAHLPLLLVACLLLTDLALKGEGLGHLVLVASGASLLIVGAGWLSINLWRFWIGIAYPLVAIWLLLPLLLVIRTRAAWNE